MPSVDYDTLFDDLMILNIVLANLAVISLFGYMILSLFVGRFNA